MCASARLHPLRNAPQPPLWRVPSESLLSGVCLVNALGLRDAAAVRVHEPPQLGIVRSYDACFRFCPPFPSAQPSTPARPLAYPAPKPMLCVCVHGEGGVGGWCACAYVPLPPPAPHPHCCHPVCSCQRLSRNPHEAHARYAGTTTRDQAQGVRCPARARDTTWRCERWGLAQRSADPNNPLCVFPRSSSLPLDYSPCASPVTRAAVCAIRRWGRAKLTMKKFKVRGCLSMSLAPVASGCLLLLCSWGMEAN